MTRVKIAWTFLLKSALFFCFKNRCKITSRKKNSLTSALSYAEQVVKLPLFSNKCIFRAEKCIFSKSSFYTKMFSDPKYSFSVCQKYFFVISKKVNIFHRIEPIHSHSLSFLSLRLIHPVFALHVSVELTLEGNKGNSQILRCRVR